MITGTFLIQLANCQSRSHYYYSACCLRYCMISIVESYGQIASEGFHILLFHLLRTTNYFISTGLDVEDHTVIVSGLIAW